ncbi:MAG: MOFRL family protein, partial [Pirellulales bacterium]
RWITPAGCRVGHLLLGSNATAVGAAAAAAQARGYQVVSADTVTAAETANDVGVRLAQQSQQLLAACQQDGRPRALIEGGEATVVVPADHGRGGRNQQSVLAAVREVLPARDRWPDGLLLASFGTDGEDGPTAAAGGFTDPQVAASLSHQPAALRRAIDRCDAHPLLAAAGGLIETGPTGTNVADVRIMLIRPGSS